MEILTPNLVLESKRRRSFRRTATEGNCNSMGVQGHAPPRIFGFREGFGCLLVISKGTFQALKQLILKYFFS